MSDILIVMGEAWHTPAKLSALLRQAPATTRAALKRLQERGQVRYRAETDEFQVYPVRDSLVAFLESDPDLEHSAGAIAQALPELGLTPNLVAGLLVELAATGRIDCWFGARTDDA